MNESGPEYSSPACFLHELDSGAGDAIPPQNPAEAQEDLRLWRKARREALIAQRLALTPEERTAASDRITERLEALLATEPRCLGFYWPFRGEYDPRPLVRALHRNGVPLALPVVVAKAQPLIFRPWWPGIKMAHGVWQIPIPAEGEPVQPDTLLVPLVGFDGSRYRLGYGGGFYDRTIAAMTSRPRTIGIGFQCGRLRTIHPQSYDIPMDEIVVA
ncbi:MAG TPA: 5-formyltetrahydrofolate cyclo-ligase [Acetobacteraceae bacterium]|jgi:5-formyltetrahydrofolate cyclo-ligase|nr:5-formyltetrahydrofolate cyclo-ligase [Acetobacteraceae bacterium]